MTISFRFRLIPCVATVAIALVGLNLGLWQTRRAEQKALLAQQIAQASQQAAHIWHTGQAGRWPAFSKVSLRGEFVANWPLYLDNRPMQGLAGRYVLMP